MKTTEVFVEQVIIGSIVLLLGYFLHQESLAFLFSQFPQFNETVAAIIFGIILVGLAYLIGIVYDRYADSIFQDFERLGRIRYVLDNEKENVIRSEDELFPEDKYRMLLYKQAQAINKEDYLRSRLRLIRALATLTPVITTVLIFRLGTIICYPDPFVHSAIYPMGIVIVYILILLRKVIYGMKRKHTPPRTDKKQELTEFLDTTNLFKLSGKKGKRIFLIRIPALWRTVLLDWTILFPVIMVVAFAAAELIMEWRLSVLLISLFGIVLTIIIFWAWWRIYQTYFSFLKSFWKSYKSKAE